MGGERSACVVRLDIVAKSDGVACSRKGGREMRWFGRRRRSGKRT